MRQILSSEIYFVQYKQTIQTMNVYKDTIIYNKNWFLTAFWSFKYNKTH